MLSQSRSVDTFFTMDVRGKQTAVFLSATCYIIAQSIFVLAQTPVLRVDEDVTPYVLFTTQFGVYRMMLDNATGGSGGEVENLVTGGYGYGALDYHYKRDLLFWVNAEFHCIVQAKLSDGSSVSVLIDEEATNPVDITVDWINDRFYWVDADLCEIWEFNMKTNVTRFVMRTGANRESSLPRGIVIYPYMNNGWLYWTDTRTRSLEMGSVHGGDRETLLGNLPCLQALTIDYAHHVVYWSDKCLYAFQSLSLNGDRETHSYPFAQNVFFVSSMAKYRGDLYWVEPTGIYKISPSEGYRPVIRSPSNARPISVLIVHPLQQPSVDNYLDIIMDTVDSIYDCDPPCGSGLGTCIPPGFCACEKGWMGKTCAEDIDECSLKTDECEQTCINFVGGYNCSCLLGYSLDCDNKTCIKDLLDETSTSVYTTPSTLVYGSEAMTSLFVLATTDTSLVLSTLSVLSHSNPVLTTVTSVMVSSTHALKTSTILSSFLRTSTIFSSLSPSMPQDTEITSSHTLPVSSLSHLSLMSTTIRPSSAHSPPTMITSVMAATTLSRPTTSLTTAILVTASISPYVSIYPSPSAPSSPLLSSPTITLSIWSEFDSPTPVITRLITTTLLEPSPSATVSPSLPYTSPPSPRHSYTAPSPHRTYKSASPQTSSSSSSSSSPHHTYTSPSPHHTYKSPSPQTSLSSPHHTYTSPSPHHTYKSPSPQTSSSSSSSYASTHSMSTPSDGVRSTSSSEEDTSTSTLTGLSSFTPTPITTTHIISLQGQVWYEEYKLVLIVIAIGIGPAIIGLLMLGVVLLRRHYHVTGSWSPDNYISDAGFEQPSHHMDMNAAENGLVSLASFQSLDEDAR